MNEKDMKNLLTALTNILGSIQILTDKAEKLESKLAAVKLENEACCKRLIEETMLSYTLFLEQKLNVKL